MPNYSPVLINSNEQSLLKPVKNADMSAKTVLTNEPWEYVDLFLVRNNQQGARFYWQQAREFHSVASGLRLQAAPLLLYYTFMNAAKALLSAKAIPFVEFHGVSGWEPAGTKLDDLSVGVAIKQEGVLPSLARYYGETETSTTHTLSDLLFNLPYIHRTYCLTFEPLEEMFIPLKNPRLVVEDGTQKIHFKAELPIRFPGTRFCRNIPSSFQTLSVGTEQTFVLSQASVTVSSITNPTPSDLLNIQRFVETLREDIYYINGLSTLWYMKADSSAKSRIRRQTTTLTLAAMHRLSEESRYHPMRLAQCLESQNNWLISEFIRMSSEQYIDEVASEITGRQFLKPNVRPAT